MKNLSNTEKWIMDRIVLKVRKYRVGYHLRTEMVSLGNGDNPIEMRSAYTPDGDYIGNPKDARFLVAKRGIKPEKIHPENNICSIGFCGKDQKWYGWSHRAIFGFGIGDKFFEKEAVIESLEQARQAAINFAVSVS